MEITILSCGRWAVVTIETAAGRQTWLIERTPSTETRAPAPIKSKPVTDPWADLLRSILGDR